MRSNLTHITHKGIVTLKRPIGLMFKEGIKIRVCLKGASSNSLTLDDSDKDPLSDKMVCVISVYMKEA